MKVGKIYKIVVGVSNDIYIGSTFDKLNKRFYSHKNDYSKWKRGKKSKCSCYHMFDKYGVENCKMILIKEYKVSNKKHLYNYEQLWINKLNAINEASPAGYIIFKSKRTLYKLYMKYYREEHKEERVEYDKKYTRIKTTCECGSVVSKRAIERHRRTIKHIKFVESKKKNII